LIFSILFFVVQEAVLVSLDIVKTINSTCKIYMWNNSPICPNSGVIFM